MDAVARALAEPRRREILELVRDRELSAGEIASRFEVTRPAVSQHLTVLRESGLLAERRDGTRRLYRARPEGLADLRRFLDRFWTDHLERLKLAAELEQQGGTRVAGAETEAVVEVEVRIDPRPETVFEFFTDPEKMVQWMGRSHELDPRPGGVFRCDINGRDVASGAYVELDPPRRVAFTWGWEAEETVTKPGTSTVEVTLEPDAGGTRVRLVHRGLRTEESRAAHAHGWDHYTRRLALAAAGDDAGPDPWATPPGADAEFEDGKRAH
jgi:uncharacterized protein YndB with AHSA1/START domain/DNA-binding transcriptional ArsR family regulator